MTDEIWQGNIKAVMLKVKDASLYMSQYIEHKFYDRYLLTRSNFDDIEFCSFYRLEIYYEEEVTDGVIRLFRKIVNIQSRNECIRELMIIQELVENENGIYKIPED